MRCGLPAAQISATLEMASRATGERQQGTEVSLVLLQICPVPMSRSQIMSSTVIEERISNRCMGA